MNISEGDQLLEIMQLINCNDQSFMSEKHKYHKYFNKMAKVNDSPTDSEMLKSLYTEINPKLVDLLDQALTFNHQKRSSI